jgi:hypothetical protein
MCSPFIRVDRKQVPSQSEMRAVLLLDNIDDP